MTRAKALKHVIRTRAEKTGERYTTARRHILRELNDDKSSASALRASTSALSATADKTADKPADKKGLSTAPPAPSKGGLSDAKSIEKTGHDLAHWFKVLDRFGGIEKGHTAAATHLYEAHHVDGWYAQGITVAFERARGRRVMNQRCDGAFEVSVSKVIAAGTPLLVKALTDKKKPISAKAPVGKRWQMEADPGLVKALEDALKDPKSKGFITRPDGQARFRFKWNQTTVQFNLYPKGPGKTSIVAQQMKLRDADDVERYRGLWKTAFAALAAAVATTA